MMNKAVEKSKKIRFKDVDQQPRVEMEGIHPTKKGTKELIMKINKEVEMISQVEFVATKKAIYADVSQHYKYGCLACNNLWDLRSGYCEDCIKKGGKLVIEVSGEKRSGEEYMEEGQNKRSNMNTTPPAQFNSYASSGSDTTPTNQGDENFTFRKSYSHATVFGNNDEDENCDDGSIYDMLQAEMMEQNSDGNAD